jgi:hypothetical protein
MNSNRVCATEVSGYHYIAMSTTPNPSPLPYASPPDTPRRQVFSFYAFGMAAFLLLFVSLVCILLVPVMRKMFADYGSSLPAITTMFLKFSETFSNYLWLPSWGLPVVAGFVTPLFVPVNATPERRKRAWRIAYWIVTLCGILFLLITILALVIPMIQLTSAIAK